MWETRIPELFGDNYNYYIGKARYINDPLAAAFKICRTTYTCVDSVLRFERMLSKTFPADKKYETVKHSNKTVQDYSSVYAKAYQAMLHKMVERRMRSSILAVGSFWYSAWVDAGQPDLDKLIAVPLTIDQRKKIGKEEAAFKAGKVVDADVSKQ